MKQPLASRCRTPTPLADGSQTGHGAGHHRELGNRPKRARPEIKIQARRDHAGTSMTQGRYRFDDRSIEELNLVDTHDVGTTG